MSRDALAAQPGSIGAALIGQGQSPREIKQQGTLIGDDEPALRSLIETIEQQVGMSEAVLVDEHGNTWPHCVMRAFQPDAVYRLGPRFAVRYLVTYLQVLP